MASMAPQLRENRPDTPKGPLAGRSPEQARALLDTAIGQERARAAVDVLAEAVLPAMRAM